METRWLNKGERGGNAAPCRGSGSETSCCKHVAREDEELTNLNWLHESKNLLTAMSLAEEASVGSQETQVKEIPLSPAHTLHEHQYISKPPYSFNCLIYMAIEGSPAQCLPVKEIYKWILEHYPYFKRAPMGWKNSVRHNLSLNRCFKRVEKDGREALGKGSFWCIDEESRPNLLQAIRKRALYIQSPPPSSSATVLPYLPYTQDPDGEIPQQLFKMNQEHGVTAVVNHDGTSVTVNEDPTMTNSCELPFLPLRKDSYFNSLTPAPSTMPSGDHNYSLVRAEEWELCPPVASDQEGHGNVSGKLGCEEGDDDSEGFLSGDEWEMENSSEDEEVKDSLADSGYVPLSLRDVPAVEVSEGSPCHGSREGLGFSGIDEELKEVAGSLLHLAGICS
ncbi:forkhead box protein N3-like [Cetorhinus maximus]